MAERQLTALETSILVYVAQNGPLTQAALEKLTKANRTTLWHTLQRLVADERIDWKWIVPESHDDRPQRVYSARL